MPLPPGPPIPPALQIYLWFRRPIPLMEQSMKRYGDTFLIRMAGWGDFVFVTRPRDIKKIFTGDSKVLHAGEGNALLEAFVGSDSVLLLDRAPHLRQRKLLLPPFHGERMQAYADVMREETDRSIDRWPLDEPFSAHAQTRDITLRVILRTVFGVENADKIEHLYDVLESTGNAAISPLVLYPPLQRNLGPLTPWTRFKRMRNQMDDAIYGLIDERKRTGARGTDIMSMLLDARDEDGAPMTDKELRDELVTLLAAGHETSATSIAWSLHEIIATPGVQDKLREELLTVVGDEPLSAEHLPRLVYTDAVVKESLRLRPIIPIVVRSLKAPFEVAGYNLPRGIVVTPCIWLVHRRPELYPDPTAFQPERFLDRRPDPYEWLPFGGGVRRCIGQAFALYEMKIVLAQTFLRARLDLAPGYAPKIVRRSISYAPHDGMPMICRSRARRSTPRMAVAV